MASLSLTVLRQTDLTANDINKFLSGSPMARLGADFVAAELETGVGADYLVAIACHESGKGTGGFAKAPYNNLFSWGIWDSGPQQHGRFLNYADCIAQVSRQLAAILTDPKNFRNINAVKKGLVPASLAGMGSWYASDPEWPALVEQWRQRFILSLDPNVRAMFWASDTGMYDAPTRPDEPVTRLMLAWAMKKTRGGTA